jgi:uncharacterized protein YqeY
MTTLIEKLNDDMKSALRSKNEITRDILRLVISDSTRASKTPDDTFVISILKKIITANELTIEGTLKKEPINQKMIDIMLEQNKIMSNYVPSLLSDDEIKDILNTLFDINPKIKIGDLMKHFKTNFPSKYDGQKLSILTKDYLQQNQEV